MKKSSYIIQEIKRIVFEQDPTAEIILYGSRARGAPVKDSDWDILILLNKNEISYELEKAITYPLYDLEFDTGQIISPMVYTESEWNGKYRITPFYHYVMKEGILI